MIAKIYHATGEHIFSETPYQPRVLAGHVTISVPEEDDDAQILMGYLNRAFALSQNFDEPWNQENPCRSTSVGDVIEINNHFFMVAGFGFKEIFPANTDLSEGVVV